MEIKVDLHTHTLATPHAYSTLMENIDYAILKGLEGIAMTDHGPDVHDAPHYWHFSNCRSIPQKIKGLTVLRGVECSYRDINATLDLEDWVLDRQDLVIASMHLTKFEGEEYLKLLLNAVNNPRINILGHIARTGFIIDKETFRIVAREAKAAGKLIELNNHCFEKPYETYHINSRTLVEACLAEEAPIVVNTDAHICTSVGDVELALGVLEEINFPEELVMNTSLEKVLKYLNIQL